MDNINIYLSDIDKVKHNSRRTEIKFGGHRNASQKRVYELPHINSSKKKIYDCQILSVVKNYCKWG